VRDLEVGNCSGRDVAKFERFGLTPVPAELVTPPLVAECFANLECKVADTCLVNKFNLFILEVVKTWIDPAQKNPKAIHHRGYGKFVRGFLRQWRNPDPDGYSQRRHGQYVLLLHQQRNPGSYRSAQRRIQRQHQHRAASAVGDRSAGGDYGTGQGWAVGWGVVWNSTASAFTMQQPPGSQNWCIGAAARS
jgi:hypothetical protein